jgi:putative membrane protein
MNDRRTRKPAAFRLDDPSVRVAGADAAIQESGRTTVELAAESDDPFSAPLDAPAIPGAVSVRAARKRGWSIGRIFLTAGGALLTFGVGVWATDFVTQMFARAGWLGWTAFALAALTAVALLALILREAFGLMRLARVTRLRADAELAAVQDDREAAQAAVRKTLALYAGRPETASGRAAVESHVKEIIDGRDLLRLAEKSLMTTLDARARALITTSARRVSVVTAVSPRALIDILFVLFEALRLMRRIGALYGGRPSGLALFRLARMTVANLAVSGGVAMTDSLVQQMVGHGLAARVSARLGEGVVNGLMMGRIGIAAMDVCRPLPWLASQPPGLKEVVTSLVGSAKASS